MMYNGVLSYYYLFTIRFGWKPQRMARIERWMHFFAICFPFVTACLGAAFGVFHELDVGFGCWTNNYPEGCEGDGCTAHIWGFTFGLIPIGFTFGSLVINNIIIYRYVRRILNATTSPPDDSTVSENSPTGDISPHATRAKNVEESRKNHIKDVAIHGFLYVGTFFFSYWSPLVLRIVEHVIIPLDDASMYPLLVLQSISLPLQGFFNMFVYNRQNFKRLRASHPSMTLLEALWTSCFDAQIARRMSEVTTTSATDGNGPSRNVDEQQSHHSAAASLSNGSPYFREHPLEYFNACAHVLASASSTGPSTSAARSSCTVPHTTLPAVVEEEGEEDGTNKDGMDQGVQRVSSLRNVVQRMSLPLHHDPESDSMGLDSEDTKEADTVQETVPTLDTSLVTPPNLVQLGHLLPVTRSFRIRMDGALELEEKQEDTS
jgi:hypothetical protein